MSNYTARDLVTVYNLGREDGRREHREAGDNYVENLEGDYFPRAESINKTTREEWDDMNERFSG